MPDAEEPIEPEVRRTVRELLQRSAAYRKLDDDHRRKLADGLAAIGATLATDAHRADADLPSFVAELIHGTFEAVVDASVEQMKAYADLVDSLAEADVPIIRDRIGARLGPSKIGMAGARLKWPP